MSDSIAYNWTDGSNKDFQEFYKKTEEYYSKIVGGIEKRRAFVPYNHSDGIPNVLIAYIGDVAVACAGFKPYSNDDAEITLLEKQEIKIPTGNLGENILLKKQEIRIAAGRTEELICMLYIGIKD